MNRTRTFPAALVALAIALHARPAPAQPLADRAPADTVAYVGWAGAQSPGAGYPGSHLEGLVEGSDLAKFFNEFLPAVLQRAAQGQPDAAATQASVAVSLHLWRHPTAVYFTGVETNAPGGPRPKITLVCRAGADAEAVHRQMQAAVTPEPAGPGAATIFRAGDVVGITTDPKGAAALAQQPAASLAGAAGFKAAMSNVIKEPTFAVYVDAQAVLRMVDEATAGQRNNPAAAEDWRRVRDALGLDGVRRFAWTQGFDGKDWGSRAFLDAPAPRKGALAMLGGKPLGDEVLKSVPVTATTAGASRFDLAAAFDGVRAAAGAISPDAANQIDSFTGLATGMLGVDLRNDLLGSLGDEWAYYADPNTGGRGPMGFVFVNRLRDEVKARESFKKLAAGINRAIVAQGGPEVKVRVKETKAGGVTVQYVGIPFITPSWAIDRGNLYVAMYPQVVASAAGQAAAGRKSILDNPDFVALRKRLGGSAAASSVQFMDLPKTAPSSYQSWLMFSSFAKFGDVFGVDSPAMLLPTMDVLSRHLAPAGSVSWTDDAGLHFRGVSPFPLSTILAADTAGMMDMQSTALAVSVLLPSLNRAREQANRVKSASNLRQMGMAVQMHANENKGRFPDDVGDLLKQDLDASVFGNPRREGATPPAGASPEELARWVREEGEYVYTGKGKNWRMTSTEVLAYEKPDGLTDGINILFGDGHVEFVPMALAQETIRLGRKPRPDAIN